MRRLRRVARVVGVLAFAGMTTACPKPAQGPVEEVPPPVGNFTPPPALGPEPPAPDGLAGRAWLIPVHEKLAERWSQGFLEQARTLRPPDDPINNPSLAVVLEINVSAKGELAKLEVATPSGHADFDAAALAAVRDAAPFPPPPGDILSDDGTLYLLWQFARDQRQASLAYVKVDIRLWPVDKAVPHLLTMGRWDDAVRRLRDAVAARPDAGPDERRGWVGLSRSVSERYVAGTLADSESGLRAAAAMALGRARLTGSGAALRALAKDGRDPSVRRAALEALGALGDQEGLPVLAEAVGALDAGRSEVAAGSMARLGARDQAWALAEPALAGDDADKRAVALGVAAAAAAPASVPVLSATLSNKTGARAERVAAARALGEIAFGGAHDAVKPLGTALLDGDAAVRAAALRGLTRAGEGGYRSRGAYYKIEPLFKDRDAEVRAMAVRAATAVEPKAAAQMIPVLARKEQNRVVLEGMATALGTLTGPETLKVLLKLSSHPEASVQRAAQIALAHRSEPDARSVAEALARSEDPALRLVALEHADETTLEASLSDASLDVRAAALERLAAKDPGKYLPRYLDKLGDAAAAGERLRYAEAWLIGTAGSAG